jgi:parallel beta-helix repeat protein
MGNMKNLKHYIYWFICFVCLSSCQLAKAADGAPSWYFLSAAAKYTNDPPTYSGILDLGAAPYNIVGDGTTDWYSTVTNAIAAATNNVTTLLFPTGTVIIRTTIQLGDAGASYLNKRIAFAGNSASNTMIRFENATGPGFYLRTSSVLGFGSTLSITSAITAGTQVLGLSSVAGLAVGDYVKVGQTNDPNTSVYNWGYTGATSDDNQTVCAVVTNISGNNITIDVPLPEVLTNSPWVKEFNSSIGACQWRNLSITTTNKDQNSESAPISLIRTTNCAVLNCIITNMWYRGIAVQESKDTVIENNWVGDCRNTNSSVYAIHIFHSSTRSRVVNNRVGKASSGIIVQDGATYTFVGYNFVYSSWPTNYNSTDFLAFGLNAHGFAPQFNLFEGNVANDLTADDTWGMNRATTGYRNWLTRSDPTLETNTVTGGIKGIQQMFTNRLAWYSLNIIGRPGQESSGKGWYPTGVNTAGTATDSTATNSTNLRWVQNYSYETSTTNTWNSDTYSNAPNSLYYDARPSWYSTNLTWPPYDPTYTTKTNWIPAVYQFYGVNIPAGGTPVYRCCGDRAL